MRTFVVSVLNKKAPRLYAWTRLRLPFLGKNVHRLSEDLKPERQTWSSRRINAIYRRVPGAGKYLEIGVQYGFTFEKVIFPTRVAVDPVPLFNTRKLPRGVSVHIATSDTYFRNLDASERFDLIFLDGLHQWFQTYKDSINALNHLAVGGTLLVDDVVPVDEIAANPSLEESYLLREKKQSSDRRWQGDVYKTVLALFDHHPEIDIRIILDIDGNSQAVIWKKEKTPVSFVFKLRAGRQDYDDLNYSSVFGSQPVREFLNSVTEDEAVSAAVEANLTAKRNSAKTH